MNICNKIATTYNKKEQLLKMLHNPFIMSLCISVHLPLIHVFPNFSLGGGGGGRKYIITFISCISNHKIPNYSLSLQVLQHTLGPTRTRSRCGR